jgi:hypothetical protein
MSLSPSPKNPFVYGRVLTAADAACRRPELEERVKQAAWDDGRIALVGDRRMGKSSLVQRTLETLEVPMLRLNYHEVLDLPDVVMRTLADIERFLRARSPIARRLVPWLREAGIEIRELRAAVAGMEIKAAVGLQTEHLKRVFGFIRDAAGRAPMALFIDELQDLRDRLPEAVGNAALAIIRDETQQMPKCPVFFAGSARESFALLFNSDASPFYQHAELVAVGAIEGASLQTFILAQFRRGHGIEPAAATLIRTLAGSSINDVQLLCYETWNEHVASSKPASAATVQRALGKILRDQTAYGEKWLADLSQKQQRIIFAAVFMEHVGATTGEFLEFAGLRNPGDLERALATTLRGQEALLEKVGSRYRFRSRFVRVWFALNLERVQALIPAMRTPEAYRRHLATVLPDLPEDPLAGLLP